VAEARNFDERERATLRSWSQDRFCRLVAAVGAGHHNCIEGSEDTPMADVFELRFITEEAERRGLPPPRIGPPKGKG